MTIHGGPDIVTDGLVLHLDAANTKSYPGTGNTWYDLSGNGKDFTWNTSDWNSEGYFRMSATTNRAEGPASNSFGIDNTTGYTIFSAFQTVAGGNNGMFKFRGNVGYDRGIFCHPGWSTDIVYFDQGGCCGSNQRISYYNANVISSVWNIVALRSLVSARSIFYNGKMVANTGVAAASINLDSRSVLINPGDENYSWNGKIAFFIVYNRGLTPDEVAINHNAIKGRYGL